MSNEAVTEYLNSIRESYQKANRRKKSVILDGASLATRFSRKHLIRLLRADRPKKRPGRGRRPLYGPEVLVPLKAIWFLMEQPCAKKMKVLLPKILPAFAKRTPLPEDVQKMLLRMSAASIDRRLKRIRIERGLCTTKAPTSSWYKSAIPVVPKDWNITAPGYAQADTVSHCGEDAGGAFASTLTLTDIDSHWTEMRATWTKRHGGIVEALLSIERGLPFTLHTVKFDSGSEFMNYEVVNSLRRHGEGTREKAIKIYRSRPYRKNDNCYVEQKNLTHVRQFIGYDRIENQNATRMLNEIYRDLWCPFLNFFMPTFKLIRKERIGSRIKKTYETPRTPYERILASEAVPKDVKDALRNRYKTLDPIELKLAIEEKLKLFMNIVRSEEQSEELKLAA
jgi:hypothetical protein